MIAQYANTETQGFDQASLDSTTKPQNMLYGCFGTTTDSFSNSTISNYPKLPLNTGPYPYPRLPGSSFSFDFPIADPQPTYVNKPISTDQTAQSAPKTMWCARAGSKLKKLSSCLPKQEPNEDDKITAVTTKLFQVYKNNPRTPGDDSSKATALPVVYDRERQMYYVRIENNLQWSPRKGDIAWISGFPGPRPSKACAEEQVTPTKKGHKRRRSSSASGDDENMPECIDYSRNAKKKRLIAADPARVYSKYAGPPPAWTIYQENGETCKIEYNKEGRIMPGTYLSAKQIKDYIEQNPRKDITLWLQNFPAQCKQRTLGDVQCLWHECPSRNMKIRQGWHQIAFDEYPEETTGGTRDPFRVAAHMHLWCFEQCFDPVALLNNQVLKPDARLLEKEGRQPFSITRDYKMIVQEAIEPWRKAHAADGLVFVPRDHTQSLACQLVQYHLENQITARSELREVRNLRKQEKGAPARTIETHKGNLLVYCVMEYSPSRNAQTPYPRSGDDGLQIFSQAWLADPRGLSNYHIEQFSLDYCEDAQILQTEPTQGFDINPKAEPMTEGAVQSCLDEDQVALQALESYQPPTDLTSSSMAFDATTCGFDANIDQGLSSSNTALMSLHSLPR